MDIILFSMIAMRMAGLIFMNPVFGRRNIPNNVKAGMTLIFTILVYSTMEEPGLSYNFTSSFYPFERIFGGVCAWVCNGAVFICYYPCRHDY